MPTLQNSSDIAGALAISAPTPTVAGGGTYPINVYQLEPPIVYSGLPSTGAPPNFYQSKFYVGGINSGSNMCSQSVKIVSLPFTPSNQVTWNVNMIDTGAGTGGPPIGTIVNRGSEVGLPGSYNGANGIRCPYSCVSSKTVAGNPFFTLTFGAANITCSAGDTLVLCTNSSGTGGSQFTFTANSAVSSSATVDIQHITSVGTSAPTTGDTFVYNVTTSTAYSTAYVKNSATGSSSFPNGVVFPSINGSNWDINIYTVFGIYSYAFTLTAQ